MTTGAVGIDPGAPAPTAPVDPRYGPLRAEAQRGALAGASGGGGGGASLGSMYRALADWGSSGGDPSDLAVRPISSAKGGQPPHGAARVQPGPAVGLPLPHTGSLAGEELQMVALRNQVCACA